MAADSGTEPGPPAAPLWRNGDYIRFRVARVTSLLGSALTSIAYPLLVLSNGGSAAQAGLVASVWLILRAVGRLPGGHLADRLDRRSLMIAVDAARFFVVATIPLAAIWHGVTYPQLLAVAAIDSGGAAVFEPASAALIRDVVPEGQLATMWAHAQAADSVISLLGPALAGILFAFSKMAPFAIDAASYGVSALLLLRLAVRAPRPGQGAATDRRATAGMRWLWSRPGIMRMLLFVALINLVGQGIEVMIIISLREHGVGSTAIGITLACIGVGGIGGSLLATRLTRWLGQSRIFVAIGVAWTAGFAAIAVAPGPYVIGPVLVLLFTCVPAAVVVLGIVTVKEAPRDLLGRVSTAEKVTTSSLATLGPILASVCLQGIGISPTWLVMCGGCAIATMVLLVSPGTLGLLPKIARPAAARVPAGVPRTEPGRS